MATTFFTNTQLTTINCGQCGGTYAIQERYRQEKKEAGGSWNCPYCKIGWGFGGGENARLKKQLEKERQRTILERQQHDQTRAELEHTELRRRAAQGQTTRIKNRVANGVCPCCNRSFKDLAAHMKTQHPDFAAAEATT